MTDHEVLANSEGLKIQVDEKGSKPFRGQTLKGLCVMPEEHATSMTNTFAFKENNYQRYRGQTEMRRKIDALSLIER